MLYVVEIRRGHDELSTIMARIREWLATQRFEPDAFRCSTDETTITCRLEFKFEREAIAIAVVIAATSSGLSCPGVSWERGVLMGCVEPAR